MARQRWQKFLMLPWFVYTMMKLKVPFKTSLEVGWALACTKAPSGQILEDDE